MALLVVCACGRQFQAKEEHAGRQAKCPSCGQILVIQGSVIGNSSSDSASNVDGNVEEMNPRAAAALLQREIQAQKDAAFMRNMMIGAGVLLAIIGVIVFVVLPGKSGGDSTAKSSDNKTAAAMPPANVPPVATKTSAPVTPPPATPLFAQVTPPPPPPPPGVKVQQFDKRTLGVDGPRQTLAGKVISGMGEDGTIVVFLNKETLQSGSTVTYAARLKLRDKLPAPIPSGVDLVFEGTSIAGVKQENKNMEENGDGTRRVDVTYTGNFADVVLLKIETGEAATPANQPALAPLISAADGPPKDDVDRYIISAAMSKDGHMKVNAKIFRPNDPRLNFEHKDRPLPDGSITLMHQKIAVVASDLDLEMGPKPAPDTDLIEARILLDADLVGDGLWIDGAAGESRFLVFINEAKIKMDEVVKRYGKPGKSLKSGDATIHFYGRIAVIELAGGKINAVARKVTK